MWSPSPRKTEARSFPTRLRVVACLALAAGPAAQAGEVSDAIVTLEAISAVPGDQVAAALPLRFALLENGQVFVGGTSQLLVGKLGKDETAALERRVNEVRKLPGLASTVTFGPGSGVRLALRKPKPLDLLVQGDPAAAPPGLLPLASLVTDLGRFTHASLRPYPPSGYALAVREGKLVGGCRPWSLPLALAEAQAGPHLVPPAAAFGWPTGATPAQVCAGDKTYVVTLRPLLPGEKPSATGRPVATIVIDSGSWAEIASVSQFTLRAFLTPGAHLASPIDRSLDGLLARGLPGNLRPHTPVTEVP